MSAIPLEKLSSAHSNSEDSSLLEKFDSRRSNELIIALAGPIGCGISSVAKEISDLLRSRGYIDVVHIKLSQFLEEGLDKGLINEPKLDGSARFRRYRRLQEAGKKLREATKNSSILAEYATKEITLDRRRRIRNAPGEDKTSAVPGKIAYLIDQVKRPEEVILLRAIYRNLFYLVGVTKINDHRKLEIESESVTTLEAQQLIEIDRNEAGDWGQKIDKTLHLADYLIRNDASNIEAKKLKLERFLSLVHGDTSITPTNHEQGMYAAYAAGLRSACLSRQVGASITSYTGEILATGCNDVPKAGGGLYSSSFSGKDMRCIHKDGQHCFNDLRKSKLKDEIRETLVASLKEINKGNLISNDEISLILGKIYKKTRIKDLIEFSRSVHAEMDAIVSLARLGGTGLEGARLYTTTFPCHNCARHIVASGIRKVFYIEPYEKSLAKELHSDSIAFEVDETTDKQPSRVEFLHYEGVAPNKFHDFFRAPSRKDGEGRYIRINPRDAEKSLPEYLDNYQEFEVKTVAHLEDELKTLKHPHAPKTP